MGVKMANTQEKEFKQEHAVRRRKITRATLWLLVALLLGGSAWGLARITQKPSPREELLAAVTSKDWVKGRREADVVLIEYGDFQCPACAVYFPLVAQLHQEFGDKIAFVYRHFPLSQIHAQAELAARATEAAGKQGKFWEMHDRIFENQANWAGQSSAGEMFLQYALALELDPDKFKSDLETEEVRERVRSDFQDGIKYGVNSTPTFFLNGKRVQPRTYGEFKNLIKQVLAGNS